MGTRSSNGRARRLRRARRLGVTLALVALLGAMGCAGKGAPRPAPADPGVPRGGSTVKTPSPPAAETPKGTASHRMDPSEEITPEELASIPEPVPGTSQALNRERDRPMETGAPAPSGGPSGASETADTVDSPVSPTGAWVWRVQIFASDRREEAERVSREASQALATTGSVDRDGAVYKVRLGRFASEAEAQALRERAIRAGYPGAFRIRAAASDTK